MLFSSSSRTGQKQELFLYVLVGATILSFLSAIHLVFLSAPTERTMGIVQKIFYFHVPSAYCMYLGAFFCLLGSIGYFLQPHQHWDALGQTGAEISVVFGSIVLVTGPLWAAKAWGYYWTWDPRLTTSLLSMLIYVTYLGFRSLVEESEIERRFAAALGILGAANIPIIHFSVRKWSGQHPTVITSTGGGLHHPSMKLALSISFLAFTLLAFLILWIRLRVEQLKSECKQLEEKIMMYLGLSE
ncbi:heme transporter [Pajaroellobacter abortibovis]|uniref:Heme exporter protein C n=2 Tax=Pajaroellobacter abortibovis TaxID=1882918 RepID=A0A1L6MZ68_9BACT|nr:heme transporter [Pajaroellobacter abortibovis]